MVDGFDFDLESPAPKMDVFANHLRDLMNKAGESSKTKSRENFYLTAAPQCPFPDKNVGDILDNVSLDAVFVQFYNNPQCGLNSFKKGNPKGFNFKKWDQWAHSTSKNKNVKVLVGAPASKDAAGSGFANGKKLKSVAKFTKKFESYGGMMIWDASHLSANKGLLDVISEALHEMLHDIGHAFGA